MSVDLPMSWPHDENGKPMAIAIGTTSDTVKTVRDGWVKMSHTIMKPIMNGNTEQVINDARLVQREAEYIVGCERWLLNQELHGNVMPPTHPSTGERFAAPPNGYDPNSMPAHPADAVNAKTEDPVKS
jgi:hypothetical protein